MMDHSRNRSDRSRGVGRAGSIHVIFYCIERKKDDAIEQNSHCPTGNGCSVRTGENYLAMMNLAWYTAAPCAFSKR